MPDGCCSNNLLMGTFVGKIHIKCAKYNYLTSDFLLRTFV